MFRTIQQSKILRGGIILAVLGILSRLVGLFRDRILAKYFGASEILDAYYGAFTIPDFIFNLVVVGAVASAFIPVFVEHQAKNEALAWQLAGKFLNVLLAGVILLGLVFFILIPYLIGWILPGLSLESQLLAVVLIRIMLLSPIIFTLSTVMGSILQIHQRFLAFGLAPIFYNLGIIFGAVYLEPRIGSTGLAWGVVLGAILHLLIQAPFALKLGFRFQSLIEMTQGVKKIIKLMIPRSISLAATQINWIILTAIATTISAGSVTIFNLANNLQFVPIAMVGLSMAVASFPTLSREALQVDQTAFRQRVEKTIKGILFVIVPISFLIFYIRMDIVQVLLGVGNFTIDDVTLTARVLGFFMLGVFAQAVIPFLNRAFFALQDTRTPVLVTLGMIILNIVLVFFFLDRFSDQILALPLAFSLASIIQVFGLLFLINRRITDFQLWKVFRGFLGDLFVGVLMLMGMIMVDAAIVPFFELKNFSGAFMHGFLLTLVALLLFIAFALIFKTRDYEELVGETK
ncbi:MAG: murein biosynthesis integral membrane protein MurJ [Candidatus Yanofskybacteria bacterium CG10_big_fil_rev_8_21_14_0_10_46_23]|uniref:Probable lipid II flippase MurJ n=1 Tax=Candidatus Yanofskybacteria bacterium CG10_big_fil_rev_8_21_14_0_10_46_23 TaxID=1975098 RepID=A0A2H0R3Z9_9BACT|nr:MAG: murein biosynthesis integral membrane protein MurJ [Candidatus Yanofskybacteria bacterium CG10_big_fil_rev_8_21_14_0_10_46_23]